jgi:two-component system, chemotaxis family, response regulator Rcp1
MTAGSGSNQNPDEERPSTSNFPFEKVVLAVPHVLIVEDNESDVFLIKEAINNAGCLVTIHVVGDGEEAVRFFDRADEDATQPCPALVILDINLPRKQGGEVLSHLRQSRRCREALVLTVSTSESIKDRKQMESLGATKYFHKPSDYEQFMKLGDIVKALLADRLLE